MYGDDDRVMTLLGQLGIMDRLIDYKFCDGIDYLKEVDYEEYYNALLPLKKESIGYLRKNLMG